MSHEQLIGLIQSDAKFMEARDDITEQRGLNAAALQGERGDPKIPLQRRGIMSKQAKANLVPRLRFPEFRAKPGKRTQFRSA